MPEPTEAMVEDLEQLGRAFTSLYLMALNGVVCGPDEAKACGPCKAAWALGTEVVDRYDPNWSIYKAFSLSVGAGDGDA